MAGKFNLGWHTRAMVMKKFVFLHHREGSGMFTSAVRRRLGSFESGFEKTILLELNRVNKNRIHELYPPVNFSGGLITTRSRLPIR